jgi:hypothetical protein
MEFSIEKGVMYSKKGIPEQPRQFVNNRINFYMDEMGISQVDYYVDKKTVTRPAVFLRRLNDGFRCFLESQGVTYKPTHDNVKIWPFGMQSDWNHKGTCLKYDVYAIEDSIVYQLTTPENIPEGLKFKFEFFNDYGVISSDEHDFRFSDSGNKRTWRKWEYDKNKKAIFGGFSTKRQDETVTNVDEQAEEVSLEWIEFDKAAKALGYASAENYENVKTEQDNSNVGVEICINTGFEADFSRRNFGSDYNLSNGKHILTSKALEPNKKYYITISFSDSMDKVWQDSSNLIQNTEIQVEKQITRFEDVVKRAPVLISPYKGVNDYVAMAPLYHEALKVTERKGAIRAKSDYWVWDWDCMTNNRSSLYWGDKQLIGDMLDFFKETSDPKMGIVHCFAYDLTPFHFCTLPGQGFYICLLHQYLIFTGDKSKVKVLYPFAKSIYEKMIMTEVGETGLGEGNSLFPDFARYMLENGHDLSGVNNTVLYCASRAIESLAVYMGDEELSKKARDFFKRTESNFIKLFYEENRHFVASSVDSQTFKKRDCYSTGSIKWENNYLWDLVNPLMNDCLDFYKNGIICDAGLREIPYWSQSFDADSNQLHCWWPVVCEFYMRAVNENNDKELVDKYAGWISYWVSKMTIPEAIPCYVDTPEPELDRWNTLGGSWYSFSITAWYDDIIHSLFGVDIDAGGMTFYPYAGEEMSLNGLHWGDILFDIDMKGSGKYIQEIEINGTKIIGTNKLPMDMCLLGKQNKIKVLRSKINNNTMFVKSGTGVEISQFAYQNNCIEASMKGAGTGRLHLFAQSKPEVLIDGEKIVTDYNENTNIATIEAVFELEKEKKLLIRI